MMEKWRVYSLKPSLMWGRNLQQNFYRIWTPSPTCVLTVEHSYHYAIECPTSPYDDDNNKNSVSLSSNIRGLHCAVISPTPSAPVYPLGGTKWGSIIPRRFLGIPSVARRLAKTIVLRHLTSAWDWDTLIDLHRSLSPLTRSISMARHARGGRPGSEKESRVRCRTDTRRNLCLSRQQYLQLFAFRLCPFSFTLSTV